MILIYMTMLKCIMGKRYARVHDHGAKIAFYPIP